MKYHIILEMIKEVILMELIVITGELKNEFSRLLFTKEETKHARLIMKVPPNVLRSWCKNEG